RTARRPRATRTADPRRRADVRRVTRKCTGATTRECRGAAAARTPVVARRSRNRDHLPSGELMPRTLIVVDVQNDFCEGGSMGVDGGTVVASAVRDVILAGEYDVVIATKDHHIDPGDHFSDHPDFVDSWPPHCVVGTPGEEFRAPVEESLFAETF